MQPYYKLDPETAFSVAFEAGGMGRVKYISHLGHYRDDNAPARVCGRPGQVLDSHCSNTHGPSVACLCECKNWHAVNATAEMLIATAIIAFFTSHAILLNLTSISTLCISMLVVIAILVRHYYVSRETSGADRNKLVAFLVLILGSSIANAAYWAASRKGWAGFLVTVSVWLLSTMGLRVLVPQARRPKERDVPMVPWVLNAVNVFLLGSIDGKSFVRFGAWAVRLLVYYFLWGLHASYDMAKGSSSVRAL